MARSSRFDFDFDRRFVTFPRPTRALLVDVVHDSGNCDYLVWFLLIWTRFVIFHFMKSEGAFTRSTHDKRNNILWTGTDNLWNHKVTNRSRGRTLRGAACMCRICNGDHVFLECSVKKEKKETAPQKVSHSLPHCVHPCDRRLSRRWKLFMVHTSRCPLLLCPGNWDVNELLNAPPTLPRTMAPSITACHTLLHGLKSHSELHRFPPNFTLVFRRCQPWRWSLFTFKKWQKWSEWMEVVQIWCNYCMWMPIRGIVFCRGIYQPHYSYVPSCLLI